MKFKFFKKIFISKKLTEIESNEKPNEFIENKELNHLELTKDELMYYDENVNFYYTNIINSLVLYTYNVKKLDEMTPILIDPLTELYEELDYAFLPILFETVFRNKLINENLKEELLTFKRKVDEIPEELWNLNILDTNKIWKKIRNNAEGLLSKLNVKTRTYNTDYTTIIFKD